MNYPLYSALNDAVEEATRFIKKAQAAQLACVNNTHACFGTKETGAARRASMDLTRSLVAVRSPKY